MARRVGPGPVFEFEWLMASRRWQGYALRSSAVLLLFAAICFVWVVISPAGGMSIAEHANFGKAIYGFTAILLLGFVGLVAPAAAAGSICQDKARGNLTLLLATDLTDAEIVLGKLASRLLPVLGLILCASPILSISTLFGGIDPAGVLGAILVISACAIFGCALALTLSIWGRKTHEVLLATYFFGIFYLIAIPMMVEFRVANLAWWPAWMPTSMELLNSHPIYLVLSLLNGPLSGMPPVTLWTRAKFLGLGLAASLALLGLSTWRIRRVVIGQLGRGESGSRPVRWIALIDRLASRLAELRDRVVPMPSLDGNPVLWRECQRRRPSRWGLVLWGGYFLVFGGFGLVAIDLMRQGQMGGRILGMQVNALQVAAGLLMLSVSATTSLAEERQRGSLDVLMATPLTARAIVWGKWWGAFRAVPRLLVLPSLMSLALSAHTGRFWGVGLIVVLILAYGAMITSLGLTLAIWIPRLGTAVGMTVGLYAAMCVAWIPLIIVAFGDNLDGAGWGMLAGSPLMGIGIYSTHLSGADLSRDFAGQTAWMIFWAIAYLGVAAGLLLAAVSSFDRSLGRMEDPPASAGHPQSPARARPRAVSPTMSRPAP